MDTKGLLRGATIVIGSTVIVAQIGAMGSCFGSFHGNQVKHDPQDTTIVFQGTVLNVAPDPGMDTGTVFVVYQLAKYSVDHICKGSYSGTEMIVDHLILEGTELKGVKVGDSVRVTVEKSERVPNRWNYPGIREESDVVEAFYVGGPVSSQEKGAGCN